jgi:hypothetical protein
MRTVVTEVATWRRLPLPQRPGNPMRKAWCTDWRATAFIPHDWTHPMSEHVLNASDQHRRQPAEPQLGFMEEAWRLRSTQDPSRVLTCGIYQTLAGVEVRVGYSKDDLVRSQLTSSLDTARGLAEQLRGAIADALGFTSEAR